MGSAKLETYPEGARPSSPSWKIFVSRVTFWMVRFPSVRVCTRPCTIDCLVASEQHSYTTPKPLDAASCTRSGSDRKINKSVLT